MFSPASLRSATGRHDRTEWTAWTGFSGRFHRITQSHLATTTRAPYGSLQSEKGGTNTIPRIALDTIHSMPGDESESRLGQGKGEPMEKTGRGLDRAESWPRTARRLNLTRDGACGHPLPEYLLEQ